MNKPKILTDDEIEALSKVARPYAFDALRRAYKDLRDYYQKLEEERARLSIPLR